MLWHLNHIELSSTYRGRALNHLSDKATDRQNNKKLVHFIVTYPIYIVYCEARLGIFLNRARQQMMYLEVEKNSITVTFLMAIFIHSKNLLFLANVGRKNCRSKMALREKCFHF